MGAVYRIRVIGTTLPPGIAVPVIGSEITVTVSSAPLSILIALNAHHDNGGYDANTLANRNVQVVSVRIVQE
jgi:hypothetical protein